MCIAVAYATECCSCYQASPISNNSKYNLLQLQLWGSESKFNKIQLKWRSVVLSLPLSLCSLFLHRWVSWGMQPADLSTRLVNINENTATCARPFPPLLLWLPLSPSFPLFPLLYSLFPPSLLPFLCFFANLQSCNHFDLIKCSLNFHRARLNWILCPKLRSLQACYLATCPIVAPQILHLILMHIHK